MDEKLLMHLFQDNLAGAIVAWYTNLEDLAIAFIRQYQYNTDIAPDRNQLQSMSKREQESIKEYAQRWRDLAAQVIPPMTEREMITIMVDTLPTFYYEKLIGYMPANFANLVFAGERIESGLRKGKFEYASNAGPNSNRRAPVVGTRKKEGDTHAVTTAPNVDENAPKCSKLIPTQPPELLDPSWKFLPNSSRRACHDRKSACTTRGSSRTPASQ